MTCHPMIRCCSRCAVCPRPSQRAGTTTARSPRSNATARSPRSNATPRLPRVVGEDHHPGGRGSYPRRFETLFVGAFGLVYLAAILYDASLVYR